MHEYDITLKSVLTRPAGDEEPIALHIGGHMIDDPTTEKWHCNERSDASNTHCNAVGALTSQYQQL